jgi:FkbM family methyltransferase
MSRLTSLYVDMRASTPVMAFSGLVARLLPTARYLGDNVVLIRTVFGQKLYLDTRDESVTPHLLLDGFWEKHVTRAYLRLLSEGATVVEIGANVGYYTTLAAGRVGPRGRVYAFEANPAVAAMLERTLRINGTAGWCTVVRQAVSDRVGTAKFYSMTREHGNSSLRDIDPARERTLAGEVEILEVPTTTLDAYFAGSVPHVDVLKIDAEGAEPLILKGIDAVLARNPGLAIVMEFAREMVAETCGDALEFLNDILRRGFRPALITASGALRSASVEDLMGIPHCDLVLRRS